MQVKARCDRQNVASNPTNDRRHDTAHRKASDNRTCGNSQDLEHIDTEYCPAVGACHFQRGNACALAGEVTAHAIADADARDDQRGEANQRKELAHTLNKAPCAGCTVGAIRNVPTRRGELRLKRFGDGGGVFVCG